MGQESYKFMFKQSTMFFFSRCFTMCSPRIHPPDVIGKYAPDSVIGNVGSGVAVAAAGGAAKGGAPARTSRLVVCFRSRDSFSWPRHLDR